jgi:SAM-dependent methyltransferase
MSQQHEPGYLAPYLRAAEVYGSAFRSLLWASPDTQAARFDAICRAVDLTGAAVLDVGCGRADLLEFLRRRGVAVAEYLGIEAVRDLASAAEVKALASSTPASIIRADFVREPARLFVGADVVVFSGSLNTADDATFYGTLLRAYDAAAETLVFNFLSTPALAAADYLSWRARGDVVSFVNGLGGELRVLEDYLPGDCTIAVVKP